MNPNICYKPPLTKKEYGKLAELVSNGRKNFSKEVLSSAEFQHPLNLNMSHTPTTHVATAPFLFRCSICTDIGFSIQWYQIILSSIGGNAAYQPSSNISNLEKGYNGKNLAKIKENDKTDYQDSSLNFLEEDGKIRGYMCDHCKDSIFDN